MPPGRHPKPVEQKRALGNPGKRALPGGGNLAAVAAIEIDPVDLDPVITLEAVFSAGRAWLASTDTVACAMLRESIEERSALRALVMQSNQPTLAKRCVISTSRSSASSRCLALILLRVLDSASPK